MTSYDLFFSVSKKVTKNISRLFNRCLDMMIINNFVESSYIFDVWLFEAKLKFFRKLNVWTDRCTLQLMSLLVRASITMRNIRSYGPKLSSRMTIFRKTYIKYLLWINLMFSTTWLFSFSYFSTLWLFCYVLPQLIKFYKIIGQKSQRIMSFLKKITLKNVWKTYKSCTEK